MRCRRLPICSVVRNLVFILFFFAATGKFFAGQTNYYNPAAANYYWTNRVNIRCVEIQDNKVMVMVNSAMALTLGKGKEKLLP